MVEEQLAEAEPEQDRGDDGEQRKVFWRVSSHGPVFCG